MESVNSTERGRRPFSAVRENKGQLFIHSPYVRKLVIRQQRQYTPVHGKRLNPTLAPQVSSVHEIRTLQEQIKQLQEQLATVTTERNQLAEQIKKTTKSAPLPTLKKAYKSLWKRLLSLPSPTQTPKKDLLSRFQTQSRPQNDDYLLHLGLNSAYRTVILSDIYQNDLFNPQKLLTNLKKYQQNPFFEDIEREILLFRRHFSLKNVDFESFETLFYSKLPQNCLQEEAIRLLISPEIALNVSISRKIVDFLWNGSISVDLNRVNLHILGKWETINDILKHLKLNFALKNVHLEEIPRFLPIPVTKEGLKTVLNREIGLNFEQIEVLTEYLFPNDSIRPIMTLSKALEPAWKTENELKIPAIMSELADFMTEISLFQVAEQCKSLSNSHISLSDFIIRCEKSYNRVFTGKQKEALELRCYKETKTLDAMGFDAFVKEIVQCWIQMEDMVPVPPENDS